MPLRPTASTPPTVAPPSRAARRTGRARRARRRARRRSCPRRTRTVISAGRDSSDPGRAPRPRGRRVDRAADVPLRAPADDATTGPASAPTSLGERRARSDPRARRDAAGGRRTATRRAAPSAGCATPSGSNASRRRAWASRSSGAEHQRHVVALLEADAVLARQHAAGRDATPRRSPRPRRAPAPSRPARAGRTTSSGCRLPSPAWNTFMTMRSCRAAIS